MLETIFSILIVLQFLVNSLHDWVDIPGWTHGRQVRATLGPTRVLIATFINGLFPGLAAAYAIYYWNQPHKPAFVLTYWLIYCAVTVFGAITSWWIPYFRGASEKTRQLYSEMYAGTIQVLLPRGDNPRPNLFHLLFVHPLGLTNLILAAVLWTRNG